MGKREGIDAFMASIGAAPVDTAAMQTSGVSPDGAPAISATDRQEMLEMLVLALLAERQHVTAEDVVGPEAATNPEIQTIHNALNGALQTIIRELTFAVVEDFSTNKLWLMRLLPVIQSRMEEQLKAKK